MKQLFIIMTIIHIIFLITPHSFADENFTKETRSYIDYMTKTHNCKLSKKHPKVIEIIDKKSRRKVYSNLEILDILLEYKQKFDELNLNFNEKSDNNSDSSRTTINDMIDSYISPTNNTNLTMFSPEKLSEIIKLSEITNNKLKIVCKSYPKKFLVVSYCMFDNMYLNNINLSEITFVNFFFKNVFFASCILNKTDLQDCHFINSYIDNSSFNYIIFKNSEFEKTTITLSDMDNCILKNTSFTNCDISASSFANSILCETSFTNSKISGCIFDNSYIYKSNFNTTYEKKLAICSFKRSYLYKVNFRGLNLFSSNFSNTKFIEVDLIYTNFSYSNLENATLSFNDLSNSNFNFANLSNVDLIDTRVNGATFVFANLSNARYIPSEQDEINMIDFSGGNYQEMVTTPEIIKLLKYNIKVNSWNKYLKDKNWFIKFIINAFLKITDYGYSTTNLLIATFIVLIIFTLLYFVYDKFIFKDDCDKSNNSFTKVAFKNFFNAFHITFSFSPININTTKNKLLNITFLVHILISYILLAALVSNISLILSDTMNFSSYNKIMEQHKCLKDCYKYDKGEIEFENKNTVILGRFLEKFRNKRNKLTNSKAPRFKSKNIDNLLKL